MTKQEKSLSKRKYHIPTTHYIKQKNINAKVCESTNAAQGYVGGKDYKETNENFLKMMKKVAAKLEKSHFD